MTDPPIDPRFSGLVQFMEREIPFNRHLGIRCVRLVRGQCTLLLPWADHLIGDPFRPALHGGVASTLIDTAGGLACFSCLGRASDRVSTVDLRVDYLRPGPRSDLHCDAKVVRMGNRVAVARMEVYAEPREDGAEPFATGHAVYNVVRRSSV